MIEVCEEKDTLGQEKKNYIKKDTDFKVFCLLKRTIYSHRVLQYLRIIIDRQKNYCREFGVFIIFLANNCWCVFFDFFFLDSVFINEIGQRSS